jgi:hypothetical protein
MLHPILRLAAAVGTALACCQTLVAQSPIRSQLVVSGLSDPIFVTAPAGDFGRLFVVERGADPLASVRLVDISQDPPLLQPWPYVTVGDVWVSGEGGLLCMAFHPQFATNGYLYLFYTRIGGGIRIVRYQAAAPYATSTNADLGSATSVLTISYTGHNGGWMGFGPDGYLYIGIGDYGGPASQDLTKLNGKLLRIDVDGDDFPSDPNRNYAIPPGNPFAGSSTAAPEVLHLGLRNPYRASFDRLTGELWIADVGGSAFEEINHVPAGVVGLNFGWDCMEGPACTGSAACVCNDPALTLPAYSYSHTGGSACVIGGYRYRGSALCGFQDTYFFADWVSASVWTFEWDGSSEHNLLFRNPEVWPSPGRVYSFGEDAAGELYLVGMALGSVYKIVPGTITDCNGNGIHDGCDIAAGTSHDWNGNGVPDECEPTGVPGCFGDGSTPTACPCGNTGSLRHGCDNSAATGGARLDGVGNPANDDVVLASSGELPTVLTVFLQGDLINTNGLVFGDGVRCATGALRRMYAKIASGGVALAPSAGDPSITARSTQLGDPIFPLSGQVRFYQAYYRDPVQAFCAAPAGNTWNISSLLAITW